MGVAAALLTTTPATCPLHLPYADTFRVHAACHPAVGPRVLTGAVCTGGRVSCEGICAYDRANHPPGICNARGLLEPYLYHGDEPHDLESSSTIGGAKAEL